MKWTLVWMLTADSVSSSQRSRRDGTEPAPEEEEATEPTTIEESITVLGIRAGEEVPVTKTDLDRQEIETLSYGQDVPQLLQYTPSTTWYSDSGIGSNYSYLSLRGIQQTRINMTFDGAPLNDPGRARRVFQQLPRLSPTRSTAFRSSGGGNLVGGLAVLRRLGQLCQPTGCQDTGGDLRLALGSFDTKRASVAYESGILANGSPIGGRFSYADTDGYRDNSGSRHDTFFLNAGWQGKRSSLRFVSFSGNEESQLAWLAVDPETLAENRQFNPLDEEERDSFGQDFAQLKYSYALREDTLLTASLYYNGADGWFRLWDDPEAQNELLQFGIDQAFVGSMVTVTRSTDRWPPPSACTTTISAATTPWTSKRTDLQEHRVQETANAFAKAEYEIGRWLLFGDLQVRWAEFSYEGDIDLGSVDWTFVDPKVGFRRRFSAALSVYGSLGRAQREPTRMDLLLGEDNATIPHDLEAVRPEEVLDLEAGVDWQTHSLALHANLYAMEFTNEIALTGELSEIGLPLRTNVDESYRRGLEIDLKWNFRPLWSLLHSANLSRNRIREWTQYYDVYDTAGTWIDSEPITYADVQPSAVTRGHLEPGCGVVARPNQCRSDGSLCGRGSARQHGSGRVPDAIAHQRRLAGFGGSGSVVVRCQPQAHLVRQQPLRQSGPVSQWLQLSVPDRGSCGSDNPRRHPVLLPPGQSQCGADAGIGSLRSC